jgi:NAD(P)-dependent dehydrogenase (short-subunit alcohol dehydrogenase family)
MSRSPVVLVTGALIGIGRAIAIRYGRAWPAPVLGAYSAM